MYTALPPLEIQAINSSGSLRLLKAKHVAKGLEIQILSVQLPALCM